MGSFEGKFYICGLFLYFVILRIFWNIFQIVNSENNTKLKPLISESKTIKTLNRPSKNMTPQMRTFSKPQPFINTQLKNLTQQKKQKGKGRRIKFRKKNFGSFDSWEKEKDTGTEMKKVLLWTGYGPLQEGMMLWGRVLSDIVEDRCEESR